MLDERSLEKGVNRTTVGAKSAATVGQQMRVACGARQKFSSCASNNDIFIGGLRAPPTLRAQPPLPPIASAVRYLALLLAGLIPNDHPTLDKLSSTCNATDSQSLLHYI